MHALKELILNFLSNLGFSLTRHQIFNRDNYGNLAAPKSNETFSPEIVDKILDFYKAVPPFYSQDIPEPLKIQGAWKGNILQGRKEQLDAIEKNDKDKYLSLLNNMFKNEMIYSMWEGCYFKNELVGKPFPSLFLNWMDGYKYLTGRSEEELTFPSGGSAWGYQAKNGIIKLIDPAQGIKAQNVINLLDLLDDDSQKAVVCDLGSGYGGDMEKVARWYKKPLRIYLVDIPLNLTTAYAYIANGFKDADLHLVKSESQLDTIIADKNSNLEFIFVPTLFVEKLAEQKINILHNHGSFSEMDANTVDYYLNILLNKDTDFMIEINSNKPAVLAKSHLEVASSEFNIPNTHSLLIKTPTWLTAKGHRYLNSIYANKKTIHPN